MIYSILKLGAAIILFGLIVGFVRNYQVAHNDAAQKFLAGKVPNPSPGGFYEGTVPGHKVSWLGKKFTSPTAGVNVFKDGESTREKYPFVTSVGTGLKDREIQVLKIDYAIPENPFWLRPIIDEIVEVAPGEYLGKLHVRIIPGFPFTLAFFNLKKVR